MDSTQHAAEAERLTEQAKNRQLDRSDILAEASVHATLALYAVIAEMTRQCDDTAIARALTLTNASTPPPARPRTVKPKD